jgi:integrase
VGDVTPWLSKRYPENGNPNTRRGAITAVKRVVSWAIGQGYIDRDPLLTLKRPQARPRRAWFSQEQWRTVLSHYTPDDPFHDFLRILWLTGCRPQEARIIEARHIQGEVLHFEPGEVPGKPWERDVKLVPEALVILKKWALKNPSGPVLRNEDGNPWTTTAVVSRFRRLRTKKKGVKFPACCYLTRHGFGADLAAKGVSPVIGASLMGHRTPTMFLNVYGRHAAKVEPVVMDALERIRGDGGKVGPVKDPPGESSQAAG